MGRVLRLLGHAHILAGVVASLAAALGVFQDPLTHFGVLDTWSRIADHMQLVMAGGLLVIAGLLHE